MRFQTISVVTAILAVVAADKVEQDDIPAQCNSVCADLVSTARRCDDQNGKSLIVIRTLNKILTVAIR